MSMTLKPEQEQVIQNLLATGKFNNADEIIDTALHLLAENYSYQQWTQEVRELITEAHTASQHTPPIDGETFVASLLERFEQAPKNQK